MTRSINVVAVIAGVVLAGSLGCTTKTEAPPLAGPSELATSITIYANPDTLARSGAAQSQITIQARSASNQPIASLPVMLAARGLDALGGTVTGDVGQFSTNQLTTGSDGRASAFYNAPNAASDKLVSVMILATPVGTDATGATARSVTISLTAPVIAERLVAKFTFLPATPTGDEKVFFDASGSTGPKTITTYAWDFGDTQKASGGSPTVDHSFFGCVGGLTALNSSFTVRLTVTDSTGQTDSTAQSVTVKQCK